MTAKSKAATKRRFEAFSDEEKGAMRDRVKELKVGQGDSEAEVLAKIAAMEPSDRSMAQRVHAIVRANAPALAPKLWYGMPSYARDGKLVCHFQPALKFKQRYATLGFSDAAKLDEGNMWANAYALTKVGPAEEAKIVALLKKALS
jgi:uncharacterized protein YdhG (YjbR/CyaY superfamily)